MSDSSLPPSQDPSQQAGDPASPSIPAASQPTQEPRSWVWDQLGKSKRNIEAQGARLGGIEEMDVPSDVKGFLRFNEYSGKDVSIPVEQPKSIAGDMLRRSWDDLMEQYGSAKEKGHDRRDIGPEFAMLSAADEIAQEQLGNDPTTQSFLPGVPEDFTDIIADRIYRGFKRTRSQEASILDLPEWGQLQAWLEANPGGRFEKAPAYAQDIDAAGSRTDRQMAAQTEIGRILNTLNSHYHSNVNSKSSIYSGQVVGEHARKLAALQLPHAFDDAPLWHKLGVGVTEHAGVAAIRVHDFNTSAVMDSFYAAAKITRALFAPGAPLPEWIENNYHPGSMELAAVISQSMGLESVPWDNESGMLVNRKQLEDRVSESIWLQATSVFGHVAGFVANPILGGTAMAAAGKAGAAAATKGIGWIYGSNVAPYAYRKLAALLGTTAGISAFNGLSQAIHEGSKGELNEDGVREYQKSMLSNYASGFATGPLFVAAGVMGSKAGDLLLRAQAPSWVARGVGGIFEGVGFAHMEDLHKGKDSLTWNLLRNPTQENWEKYAVNVGANAMAMGLFHLVHASPQKQMRDAIMKEHGVDVFGSDYAETLRIEKEQKASRQIVRTSFEQMSEGIAKEHHQPSILEMMLPKKTEREAFMEKAEKMGRRGLEEQDIEFKTGVASEQLVPPKGEARGPIARDFPLRLMEWNRRRQAAGGKFSRREFGGFVVLEAGKEGDLTVLRAKQGEMGTLGHLPSEAHLEAAKGKRMVFFHTHPTSSFFSGGYSDLGVFKSIHDTYERTQPGMAQEKIPFVVSGTGNFLVANKIPGKTLGSREDIQHVYDKVRSGVLRRQLEEAEKAKEKYGRLPEEKTDLDAADLLKFNRIELESSVRSGEWDKVGLEMNVYTPEEFHSLWRHYLDGNKWETDPFQVESFRLESEKRHSVTEGRRTPGIYPDVGSFIPEKARRTTISKVERQELLGEPDAEGFRRTAEEIKGEGFPSTQSGTMRAAEEMGVPRPELVGAGEGLYHQEPQLPHPRVEAPGVPPTPPLKGTFKPPAQATPEGQAKLEALFGREPAAKPQGSVLGALRSGMQATKTYFKDLFAGRRNLMADVRAGRLGAAEALENLGYRRRFQDLGEFKERFIAEVDRLNVEVGNASRLAGQRVMDALEPLGSIGKGSADPKAAQALRQRSVRELMELLYLKDFVASGERGETLPLGLRLEDAKAKLDSLSPTQEVLKAAANIREMLDQAGEQLVARGALGREFLKPDYMPHKVADFFDAFESFTPGRTIGRLREAFRGYTKARKGSERMIDTDPEALVAYLTQVNKDNAIHDFIVRNGEAVHQRMIDVLDNNNIRRDFENMTPDEWAQARQDLNDKGMAIFDSRTGTLGKRNLAQDPVAQMIYREFADRGEMQMPDILEVGKNIKPNPEKQVYLVPKEVAKLWSDIRSPKKTLLNSPTLNAIRKTVGQWFKAPALRGLGGLMTLPRQARNLYSDAESVFYKKTLAETKDVMKRLPQAHRFSRALADREWRKKNLSPSEEGLLQELELHGTALGGETGEALGQPTRFSDHPVFKQIYGDWNTWWNFKKHYQGNYAWVNKVDTYSENLFRAAVWLSERSNLIRSGMDAESAARSAHLEVGRVLVDYRHNTALEANVLNTLAFPFYTWVRHQVTNTLSEGLRRPLPMLAKYGTVQAALMAWNYAMAEDEESKLLQSGNRIAQNPHVWLPWIKDSEGNPMVLQWEGTADMVARFFGLGGSGSKLGDYLFGHGDADILWRDIAAGGIEESALTGGRFMQDWMAPWFRAAGGWLGFRSKFVYPSELAGSSAEKAITAARPINDVIRLFDDRKTIAQKTTNFLPFGKFVELTEGVPADKRGMEFFAGRQQRHEAQLNLEVKRWLPRIDNAFKRGDFDSARKTIDGIWDDFADDIAPLGYTKLHVANRVWNALQNRWRLQIWDKLPGKVSGRFYALNDQQKIAALREMGMLPPG